MSDFLFELGMEEVPVGEIESILTQLKTKLQFALQENLVEYGVVETAATNKRFMIHFEKINDRANDRDEQIKGPAKRIAYENNGQPSVALQKFVEFNQIQFSDLSEIETKKGTYIVVDKKVAGLPTVDILKRVIPTILSELTFGKTMVWNTSRVNFIRPIKNLLVLFDNKVLPLEFAGIRSSHFVTGHHLLSETPIVVNSFRNYCELLGKNFVLLREEDRKEKILSEIKEIEEDLQAVVKLEEHMLLDYIYNNEYPVVFQGTFDRKYLELPSEIISTFMIKEKKLMPVFDRQGNLMNVFVGVSNIPDENRYVKNGNERVIRATFEDAKFFWDDDRKDDFIGLRDQLKNVMFHVDLGNFFEKTERMVALVDLLVELSGQDALAETLKMAAMYCKNDLVTRMVREFPSLQGIMGGLYLKEKGITPDTWKAVYGHYEPKGFQNLPFDYVGAGLLSIADKIDNIAGFLSKGIKISSSKDPYGIRRDANAILKILLDLKLDFDLLPVIQKAAALFVTAETEQKELVKKINELFVARVEGIFKEFMGFRYDVVNATLRADDLSVYRLFLRASDVAQIAASDSVTHLIALHKRLKNIVKNAPAYDISENFLKEKAEILLFEIFKESKGKIETLLLDHQYVQGCSAILEMKPMIDQFFEAVHVMADDVRLKENRVAIVQKLDQLLSKIADFSLLVEV